MLSIPSDSGKYIRQIYERLFSTYGSQKWWPAKTRFEVIVGAILTQNTNWKNVEQALRNLRRENLLNPSSLNGVSCEVLGRLIRPAGYFNVKARRIKNFVDYLFLNYGGQLNRMQKQSMEKLRQELLSVNGIGPETADSILLYAFKKPVFVVDAYTRRILSRHRLVPQGQDYHQIQQLFSGNLEADTGVFNEYHALIVRLGKETCRPKPLCDICPLKDIHYSKEWMS